MKSQTDLINLLKNDFAQTKITIQAHKPLWGRNSDLAFLEQLETQLNLHRFMSPSQLRHAISIVEQVKIGENSFKTTFDKCCLDDMQPNASQPASKPLKCVNTSIVPFLTRLHSTLLRQLKLAHVHSGNTVDVSSLRYNADMLEQSQPFYDLINTSKAPALPDKSTSVKDFRRRCDTIYGAIIHPATANDDNDPAIIDAIEGFAGDAITSLGAKANKIYQFGGQFLTTVLLTEFSNTVEFKSTEKQGLERGMVKANINWTKKDGEIVADIQMKILTCCYADPLDKNALQRFYAIGSDGLSLLEMDEDELERINARCSAEIRGETEDDVVPICTLSAKLHMPVDAATGHHYLKANAFEIHFYTDALQSIKAIDFSQVLNHTSMPG